MPEPGIESSGLNLISKDKCSSLRTGQQRAGEMAQWLRALTVLPEVLSSIPSNHMVAHNQLQCTCINKINESLKKNSTGSAVREEYFTTL